MGRKPVRRWLSLLVAGAGLGSVLCGLEGCKSNNQCCCHGTQTGCTTPPAGYAAQQGVYNPTTATANGASQPAAWNQRSTVAGRPSTTTYPTSTSGMTNSTSMGSTGYPTTGTGTVMTTGASSMSIPAFSPSSTSSYGSGMTPSSSSSLGGTPSSYGSPASSSSGMGSVSTRTTTPSAPVPVGSGDDVSRPALSPGSSSSVIYSSPSSSSGARVPNAAPLPSESPIHNVSSSDAIPSVSSSPAIQ